MSDPLGNFIKTIFHISYVILYGTYNTLTNLKKIKSRKRKREMVLFVVRGFFLIILAIAFIRVLI